VSDVPTDLETLCAELATLYRQLADAITPAAEPDKSLAPDTTSRWCVTHEHFVPFGPVDIRRHVLGPKLTLATAVMPTAAPDEGARRGVPGSRPPLSGPAMDALVAQEGIQVRAVALANDVRAALGHETVHRDPLTALMALPKLVESLPDDHMLRRRLPAVLWGLRQRARDVLGLSQRVQWLGPCPTTYEVEPFPVLTRDGLVTNEGHLGCWSLDLAAMVADGGEREIWRRSELAWLRDKEPIDVVCFACRYRPELDGDEVSDLVVQYFETAGKAR
jgi:hypothetical protein